MASLDVDGSSRLHRIRFRFAGRSYKRSLKTTDRCEAMTVKGRVEETIRLLERGRLEMPLDADSAAYIMSDGRINRKPLPPPIRTVTELFDKYRKGLPEGAKEQTTLKCEEIHVGHLKRHLGPSRNVLSLLTGDLQTYIDRRLQEQWHNKPISPETVKKEVTTFRLVWNWAVDQGFLKGVAPTKGLKYPKTDEKPPFMTWDKIERIFARKAPCYDFGGSIWDCLFLRLAETEQLLEHVRVNSRHSFIYQMFVFAAHTGTRRSEILRSRTEDFDFDAGVVQIREKKKSKKKSITFRRVPMTDLLLNVMSQWFEVHPGGQNDLCQDWHTLRGKRAIGYSELNPMAASYHFNRTLANSRWEKVKGFHVFRHSFASNLAAAGVDQRIIDDWMGHQTEEMRRRYRHLFPDQLQRVIGSVFGRSGK